jgi:hypothetical protein
MQLASRPPPRDHGNPSPVIWKIIHTPPASVRGAANVLRITLPCPVPSTRRVRRPTWAWKAAGTVDGWGSPTIPRFIQNTEQPLGCIAHIHGSSYFTTR